MERGEGEREREKREREKRENGEGERGGRGGRDGETGREGRGREGVGGWREKEGETETDVKTESDRKANKPNGGDGHLRWCQTT